MSGNQNMDQIKLHLIAEIIKQTGLSAEEIMQRSEQKAADLKGLIKSDAAMVLVAKDLGVDLGPAIRQDEVKFKAEVTRQTPKAVLLLNKFGADLWLPKVGLVLSEQEKANLERLNARQKRKVPIGMLTFSVAEWLANKFDVQEFLTDCEKVE